jgi:hypothetical protein
MEKESLSTQLKVYDDLFEHAMHDHQFPVELIAGTMMAIAQRLYKTHLNEEEYEDMMKTISENKVEPYNVNKVRIH